MQIINGARIQAHPIRAAAGIAMVLIRGTAHARPIAAHAAAFGLKPAEVRFQSRPARNASVPGRDVTP